MKWKMFLHLFGIVLLLALFTQCGRYGKDHVLPLVDDDSDRPAWAGGNTDANTHIKGNDDSGTTRGGDYGDLYKLLRDQNGVPVMWQEPTTLEWYVQPIGDDGSPLELDAEGELVDPTLATEVDFGRLNIVRSPQSVLDQAFEEAMKVLKGQDAVITLDFCGRLTSTYFNTDLNETVTKTIDSPRENMAIYQYIMRSMFEEYEYEDGEVTARLNRLAFLGQAPYNFDALEIAASCFAAGSDKTGTVDIDEVVYINGFVDCIGCNPILNEHEYLWSIPQPDAEEPPFKRYFNFGEVMENGPEFTYNRNRYANRWLKVLVLGDDGTYEYEIVAVQTIMEGLWDGNVRFNGIWSGEKNKVEGFAIAVDDAVQVLEFVHGDSNIEFLPDYVPPTP